MAITFDPTNKIIQLDSFTVTERQLWTAYVDWSVEDDNLKYGVNMEQIGGVEPIALYIYLLNGWKIRPLEADGITTVKGNVLTDDNSHPVTNTVGDFQALVNMETPLQAVGINTGSVDLDALAASIAGTVWDYTK